MIPARNPLWAALALAGLAAGCRDHPAGVYRTGVPAGRVEGFVRMAVTPITAGVRATLVPDSPGNGARFDTEVARDGSYAIDLPAGRYVLGVRLDGSDGVAYEYSAVGLSAGDFAPDTLRIDAGHSPLAVNFELATLRIHLDLPAVPDGMPCALYLHRPGIAPGPRTRTHLFRRPTQVRNGAVDELLTGLLPASYKVEVVLADFVYGGEHWWVPGVRDSSLASRVGMAANQLVVLNGGLGGLPGRLQGRISGAWLELGLLPPTISLFAPDSSVVSGVQPTGIDGAFDQSLYLARPVKLRVSHAGVDQWIGGNNFASATVFDLQPGQTIRGIDAVESAAIVELISPASTFAFTTLEFYAAATSVLAARWRASFAPSPRVVVVPNLRPGSYRLYAHFTPRGFAAWAPQWYAGAEQPGDARVVTIGTAGEVIRVTMSLQKGGTLSGTAVDARGESLDAVIYVTPAASEEVWGSRSVSVGSPAFKIEGLPNGRWKIGAWRRAGTWPEGPVPPPGTLWYPAQTDWRSARVFTIAGFEDLDRIDFRLPAPPR